MNHTEFDEWFKYHCGLYPGIPDWFKRMGALKEQQLDAWRATLRPVDLKLALQASDMLFSGKWECPTPYNEHPKTIKNVAFYCDMTPAHERKTKAMIEEQERLGRDRVSRDSLEAKYGAELDRLPREDVEDILLKGDKWLVEMYQRSPDSMLVREFLLLELAARKKPKSEDWGEI